jgi:hypothetical protein
MVAVKRKVATEFLHFLADISDPATGDVSCIRLAGWLGMTEAALRRRWIRRGTRVPWQQFVDEVLSVLDAAQAQQHGLEQAIDWYFNTQLEQCGRRTADELVLAGEAGRLLRELDVYGAWMHAAFDQARPRVAHERKR